MVMKQLSFEIIYDVKVQYDVISMPHIRHHSMLHSPVPVSVASVAVTSRHLEAGHQREAEGDGQRAHQPRHAVPAGQSEVRTGSRDHMRPSDWSSPGQLVPGQHLEEGDVEQSARRQTLENKYNARKYFES